ncbi:SdpI family protein [Clostridium thermarum]|uniref:SdpI family protein n=1 Tax=Clostridium thermarum TaxID=1716543 RepID=UPI00111DB311|nr:SdpI family protein [Clostridium thermarum]
MDIFFWFVDLSIPVTMLVIGLVFIKFPPRKINNLYGYRTKRSMSNEGTWKLAHLKCGQIWIKVGIVLLIAVLLSKLYVPVKKEILSLIHIGIGIMCLFIPLPFVESALKKYLKE